MIKSHTIEQYDSDGNFTGEIVHFLPRNKNDNKMDDFIVVESKIMGILTSWIVVPTFFMNTDNSFKTIILN